MTIFVENLLSREVLNAFRNQLVEFQLYEDFLPPIFLILKSSKINPEAIFPKIVVEKCEIDIELLNSQIQSFNFQDPKEFLENSPFPKQEEIVLRFDLQIEDDYDFKYKTEEIVSGFNIEDTTNKLVIEGLEEKIIHHVFYDPIADYMEIIFSSSLHTCFLYEDQIHQKFPLHIIFFIMKTHDKVILPSLMTSSQIIHSFLQLLDWLHWHFCIT